MISAAYRRFFFAEEPLGRLVWYRRGMALWTCSWALVHLPYADEIYSRSFLREGIYDRWTGGPPPSLALVIGLSLALALGLGLVLAERLVRPAIVVVWTAFAALYVLDAGQLRAYTTLALVQWGLLGLGALGPSAAPRWSARLMMLQVSAVYFFAALAKLIETPLWRDGEAVARIFGSDRYGQHLLSSLAPAPGPWTVAVGWAVIALELFIALGLWHRRTRLAAAASLVALHLGIALTMKVSLLFHSLMALQLALFWPLRPRGLSGP